MAPPEFRLRLRKKHDTANAGLSGTSNEAGEKLSRRMLLKMTDPEKYAQVKEQDRLRSALRRLDRTNEKRQHDNRLAAIRQRRYRANKKEKQKAQQRKNGKNRDQRYKTRSELQKLADKKAKDAKCKRERRAALSAEEREEVLKKRREKYEQDKLEKSLAKQTAASTQTSPPPPTPDKDVPAPSSSESRRQRLCRARLSLPEQPNQYAELVMDLMSTRSPRKKQELTRMGVNVHAQQKQQQLDEEITKIVAKEVKSGNNKHLASALNKLKQKRLQQYASKRLKFNRKVLKINKEKCGRKAALDAQTVRQVEDFYKSQAQAVPDKKFVSKKTGQPRMLLTKPIKYVYQLFRQVNPATKVKEISFYKNRPDHIRKFQQAKYRGCACGYCENIRLKIAAIDKVLQVNHLGAHKLCGNSTALTRTMCLKAEGEKYNKLECIKRKCPDCGVDKSSLEHVLPDGVKTTQMIWKRWGNVKVTNKKTGKESNRKGLVSIEGTLAGCIKQLDEELETFSEHIFNWRWQADEFRSLKQDLPEDWVLSVWDFAENFTCFHQDEAQSVYWSRNQATIHPVVTNYACPTPGCDRQTTESIVFVSPDLKHDHHAVHQYMDLVTIHLNQRRGIMVKKLVRFSDGCAGQYKSFGPFADIAHAHQDYNFSLNHNYYGSRHGKGASDGESAVVKSHATNAIKAGTSTITNAWDLYEHCMDHLVKEQEGGSCCHYRRSFYYVDDICRTRPRTDIKTVQGSQSFHSILGCTEPDRLMTRTLSCFCEPCRMDNPTQACQKKNYVEEWELKMLEKKKPKATGNQSNADQTAETESTNQTNEVIDGTDHAEESESEGESDGDGQSKDENDGDDQYEEESDGSDQSEEESDGSDQSEEESDQSEGGHGSNNRADEESDSDDEEPLANLQARLLSTEGTTANQANTTGITNDQTNTTGTTDDQANTAGPTDDQANTAGTTDDQTNSNISAASLTQGMYVAVRFRSPKKNTLYMAMVSSVEGEDVTVSFLKRGRSGFYEVAPEDDYTHPIEDIAGIVTSPKLEKLDNNIRAKVFAFVQSELDALVKKEHALLK